MARLVWVALVCWPTPFHMYMLTRPVVRQHERGLPNFVGRHPGDFFGFLRREFCGDLAEPLEDRLTNNFIAVFRAQSARAEECGAHVVAGVRAAVRIVNDSFILRFVPNHEAILASRWR